MPLPQNLPPVDGYIAVLDCSEIGQTRLLRYQDKTYTVLIADCSGHASTSQWMRNKNVIAEVDYRLARQNGFVGRGVKGQICEIDTRNRDSWDNPSGRSTHPTTGQPD